MDNKEYTPQQLKQLDMLYHGLNSAIMFEQQKVEQKEQAIKDWHTANDNLKTPFNWNAPCID